MRKITLAAMLVIAALAPAFAQGKITLRLWTHEDPNRQKMEEQFAKEYMAKNPHVAIEYSVYPSTKIQDLIPAAYAAKNAPSIWNLELQKAYPIYMQGLCAPIPVKALGYRDEKALIDSYLPGMLDPVIDSKGEFGARGRIYGLPLEMVNFGMFLNKKIFRDAGLDPDKDYPKTWEDVMAVSEKIVKRNGNIVTRRGFDFRYGDYLISWTPMVEQLGGKVISDNGREAIVGESAWVKALTYMQQWGPNGKNLGSPTYTAARRQFDNNRDEIAMHLSGIYQEARMKTANPDFFNSKDWMVIPYPVFQGGKDIANPYYFQYYMVSSQIPAREQEEAWKFVAYMLSHGDDYLEKVALTQPTKAVFDGAKFKAMPFSDVFRKDLARANVVYFSGYSWRVNELIKAAIEDVMMNKVEPRAAYLKLKKEVKALVDENR